MPTGRKGAKREADTHAPPPTYHVSALGPGKRQGGTETRGWGVPEAALTLGVGFLEGVASVHKAGGCVMFALELQMQLGGLAEGAPGSCNRTWWPQGSAGAPGGQLGAPVGATHAARGQDREMGCNLRP